MTEDAVLEQDQTAATGADAVQVSEADQVKTDGAQAGATEALEKVTETDEQKNERVQREAQEKSDKRAKGVQKRMDELTAEKHANARRADEALAQNAKLIALLEGRTSQPAKTTVGEPTREQFETYEDFIAARAEFRAEAKATELIDKATKTQQEQTQRQTAQQAEQAAQREYLARQKEVSAKIPDFAETMADADIEVPRAVYDMIRRMPDGPLIAYNMAKNPDLAQQFADNPPELHGVILGQISATLKASSKSNAPAPGKPVVPKAGSSNDGSAYTGPPEGYYAWANKHLK